MAFYGDSSDFARLVSTVDYRMAFSSEVGTLETIHLQYPGIVSYHEIL